MHAPITETEGREIERERDHGDINHINKNKTKKRHAIHARTHARTHVRQGTKTPRLRISRNDARRSPTYLPIPARLSARATWPSKTKRYPPITQRNKKTKEDKETKKQKKADGAGGEEMASCDSQGLSINQNLPFRKRLDQRENGRL